jgi:hypothetical protein
MDLWDSLDSNFIFVVAGTCIALLASLLYLFYSKLSPGEKPPKLTTGETSIIGREGEEEKGKIEVAEEIKEDQRDAKGILEDTEKGEEGEEIEDREILPDEMYFEIFSFLNAEEMEPLSLISWRWKGIVEDSRLWVSLYLFYIFFFSFFSPLFYILFSILF